MTSMKCFFLGHDKEYGAVVEQYRCDHPYANHGAAVRWACRRCGKMGQRCVTDEGCFQVYFGRLEPDAKRWLSGEGSGVHGSQVPRQEGK